MNFLGGNHRKTFVEIEAHLIAQSSLMFQFLYDPVGELPSPECIEEDQYIVSCVDLLKMVNTSESLIRAFLFLISSLIFEAFS